MAWKISISLQKISRFPKKKLEKSIKKKFMKFWKKNDQDWHFFFESQNISKEIFFWKSQIFCKFRKIWDFKDFQILKKFENVEIRKTFQYLAILRMKHDGI